jgi:hypothetical protein
MARTVRLGDLRIGDTVVICEDALAFFDADRANVLHEIVDVVRAGYRIAPLGACGPDWSRVVNAMVGEIRRAGAAEVAS